MKFVTDTDTEALAAHMVAAELRRANDDLTLEEARVIATLRRVEGTYGLVVLDTRNPDQLVVARNGSPIPSSLDSARPRCVRPPPTSPPW